MRYKAIKCPYTVSLAYLQGTERTKSIHLGHDNKIDSPLFL
jgi:hypothetical protein